MIEVLIPKCRVTGQVPELLQIEGAGVAPNPVAQWSQVGKVDPLRPEEETVWPFVELEPVTRTDPESTQHRRGKSDFVLSGDFDSHNSLSRLPKFYSSRERCQGERIGARPAVTGGVPTLGHGAR